MTQPLPHPNLTPQFCFSTVALRDFLRISRASIDDTIMQNLNNLSSPSSLGFDPSSTSNRYARSHHSRQIAALSCKAFKDQALFPSWQMRSDILDYCASVARSPDPDDPESISRLVESEKEKEKVVNERLDPYTARNLPREARTERLAAVIRQEQGVENIIRARTWGLVADRCGDDWKKWDEALEDWRRSKPPR